MKALTIAITALLVAPAGAFALGTSEIAKNAAQEAFSAAAATSLRPLFFGLKAARQAAPAPQAPAEPILQEPVLTPVGPHGLFGASAGKINLTAQLDHHRGLLNRQLGALSWDF